tara:strand:+ start:1571 stop:2566 length:996 start_codon:yes stop_codon:yes gene_type:complete
MNYACDEWQISGDPYIVLIATHGVYTTKDNDYEEKDISESMVQVIKINATLPNVCNNRSSESLYSILKTTLELMKKSPIRDISVEEINKLSTVLKEADTVIPLMHGNKKYYKNQLSKEDRKLDGDYINFTSYSYMPEHLNPRYKEKRFIVYPNEVILGDWQSENTVIDTLTLLTDRYPTDLIRMEPSFADGIRTLPGMFSLPGRRSGRRGSNKEYIDITLTQLIVYMNKLNDLRKEKYNVDNNKPVILIDLSCQLISSAAAHSGRRQRRSVVRDGRYSREIGSGTSVLHGRHSWFDLMRAKITAWLAVVLVAGYWLVNKKNYGLIFTSSFN